MFAVPTVFRISSTEMSKRTERFLQGLSHQLVIEFEVQYE